ncbi:hypothetical protein ACHAXN_007613 [Cyclotella atomus]
MPRKVAIPKNPHPANNTANNNDGFFPQPPDPTHKKKNPEGYTNYEGYEAPPPPPQQPQQPPYGADDGGNNNEWNEWQWGSNNNSNNAGYGNGYNWWSSGYYEDPSHGRQNQGVQHRGGHQHPPQHQQPHHEQYPAYQEFMPPLDKTDKKDNQPQQHNQYPQHSNQHYYYPPYPPQNLNPNINPNANHHPPAESKKRTASGAIKESRPPQHVYPPPPPNWPQQNQQQQHQHKAREHMIQLQSNVEPIPVYPYTNAFTKHSWNEMISMLHKFATENPGLDLETETNDQQSLIRTSWIKEIRWIRRARAPSDEKSPKATRGRDKVPNFPPLPDCLVLTPQRIATLDSIHFPWHHDRSVWQKWLDDLNHYRAKSGESELNVPLKYVEYPSLGNFVNRQRTEYKKLLQGRSSSMTSSKIADLNRVGFTWSVREGGHTAWDIRFMELKEYRDRMGNCNVPKIYPANPSLGYWVNEQRFQYRRMINNKSTYMTETKVAHLNSLGFIWTLRESKKPWTDWLEELRDYKKIHGHCDVPLKYEKNQPLGAFVNNQRSEYRKLLKGEPSSMNDAKIKDLEAMGFHWSVREGRTPWNARMAELLAYKDKYGDTNVPRNWEENPSLSIWVETQRQQYKLYGKSPCRHMTKERVEALNDAGFDWNEPPESKVDNVEEDAKEEEHKDEQIEQEQTG